MLTGRLGAVARDKFSDPSGTVQPWGRIEQSYLHQGSKTRIQSGHRYLAFLYFDKNNGEYFDCSKTLNLSSGVAQPTDSLDILAAKNATPRFAGMVEDSLITAVKATLSSSSK
jgi:hypothetical protein